jgi:hypothetical protein
MLIAIILIFGVVALFLILRDDHDDSYTRREPKSGRENGQKSVYQKSAKPRRNAPTTSPTASRPAQTTPPSPVMGPRTIVPEEKKYRPSASAHGTEKALDFSFLDELDLDPNLPEKTMSSFIAGLQGYCTRENLGGVLGYIMVDPVTGAMEVHDTNDSLMGYLPMKDRAAYNTFNPNHLLCPFAGHIGLSTTGRYYADIRIVLPTTRTFVEDSLRGFLG